jgi:hypothetical protein
MPPRAVTASVKHLTAAELGERWTRTEKYIANLRSANRGPAYIRGESDGDKALILYRLVDVEAYEESRLIRPGAEAVPA